MRRRVTLAAVIALTGCGGGDAPPRRAPAPVLLSVQRNGGVVATAETLTVRRDGTAELDQRFGKAGRKVRSIRIADARMRVIRDGLERLPGEPPAHRAQAGAVTWILRHAGREYVTQDGALGPARPLIRALDDVIAGGGRSDR